VIDRIAEGARSGARMAAFPAYLAGVLAAWELERLVVDDGPRRDERLQVYRRRVSGHILRLFGVEIRRVGSLDRGTGPRLIVANHRTALDIGVLLHEVGGIFLSRSDLAEWPLVGRVAKEANTIFVDREDRRSGALAIRTMRRRLREGQSVMVFPEGATFVGDEVRPFLPGAFVAARGLGAEIVPVGLAYPEGLEYVGVPFVEHVRAVASRPRTRVGVHVGAPFPADGKPAALAERAQMMVQSLVHSARAVATSSR
jgi:lyso-ornithine lipid O-acyltransferase